MEAQRAQGVVLRQPVSPVQKFLGTSKAAQKAREFAEMAAMSDLTLLIRGETGTGKDHLAELIHQAGRNGEPFVVVDCGLLTETLSESELLGHVRGAFTDAREAKAGLVKLAGEGTLFFNEVANMGLGLQAKFLRILDKKPFRPIGGMVEIPVRARIIAASNANLEEMVKSGTFRHDLYHRLNVISFYIAPLRERKEDILELASTFLQGSKKQFSNDVLLEMMQYDWPGNVRELQNFVQRYVLMSKEREIDIKLINPLPTGITENESNSQELPSLKEFERNHLCLVLKQSNGVIKKVAKIAGITRVTMHRKIRKFGLKEFVENLRK